MICLAAGCCLAYCLVWRLDGGACDMVRLAYHSGLALRQALLESRSGFLRCLSSQHRKSVRLSMQHKRFDDSVNFRSPPSSSRLVLHKLCNIESLHQADRYVILEPKSQPAGIWFCSRHGFDWPTAPPSQLWKGSHWVSLVFTPAGAHTRAQSV